MAAQARLLTLYLFLVGMLLGLYAGLSTTRAEYGYVRPEHIDL